jgi:hypothetical protein
VGLPAFHEGRTSERLEFGPRTLRLYAPPQVVLSGDRSLSYSLVAEDRSKRIYRLHWTVVMTAEPVLDTGGDAQDVVSRRYPIPPTMLGWKSVDFSLRLPTTGAFRLKLRFFTSNGGRLGSVAQYVRAVPRIDKAALMLGGSVAHPGQRVVWRMFNGGSSLLTYGHGYVLQKRSTTTWIDVMPPGYSDLMPIELTAGESSKCDALRLPADADPGEYRLKRQVRFSPGQRHRWIETRFSVR